MPVLKKMASQEVGYAREIYGLDFRPKQSVHYITGEWNFEPHYIRLIQAGSGKDKRPGAILPNDG
jgi:hypothetical protein